MRNEIQISASESVEFPQITLNFPMENDQLLGNKIMTHVWQTYVASQGDIKFALRHLWANKLYLKIALPAPDHTEIL